MKTMNDYLKMPYRMEIVKDEGGFVVSYPGCITCGETLESALANAMDAKKYGLKQYWKKGLILMSRIVWKIILDSSNCGFLKVCIAKNKL